MKISLYETRGLLLAAGLALGIYVSPAAALSVPYLETSASGLVHYYPLGTAHGPFQVENASTGPVTAHVTAGNVFTGYNPSLGVFVGGTLFADSRAVADYGTNRAVVESNVSAGSGDDPALFPAIELVGGTLRVETSAQSTWTDVFTITGGSGVGTANVSVLIHGHAATRYGANGDSWYGAGLEPYGTSGYGFAQYGMDINYDALPSGLDSEYNHPIRWEQNYFPPDVPSFVTESPIPRELLTGEFAFEYGVPFSLTSYLSLSGYNQITIDFDHTATLSYFDLPEGASLESGSGHLYATSAVPIPAAVWLFGSGLLGLIGVARSKGKDKEVHQ